MLTFLLILLVVQQEEHINPYDLGRAKNIRQTLGPNVWMWWYPSVPQDNGFTFETNGLTDEDEAIDETFIDIPLVIPFGPTVRHV